MRLRDTPHGHVAAVAPAGKSKAMLVNGSFLERLIHAGHNVAPVAISEIFHVGARKLFAFAKAAAWIGQEDEISSTGKGHPKAVRAGPGGARHCAGTPMNLHYHGIFF